LQYLPACLEDAFGVEKASFWGAIAKGGPLILGAAGCLIGGWLTDSYLRRTGNRRWARRIFGMIGHGFCVPLYLICLQTPNAWTFAAALALTGFFNDLAIGSAWATCQDIGRRHAAIVAGCMNTIGNLGGFACAKVVGWLLLASRRSYLESAGLPLETFKALSSQAKRDALTPGYDWALASFAGIYVVSLGLWLLIDATKPVLPEDVPDGVSN
jgi:nitrate/nitrite transporter NarK